MYRMLNLVNTIGMEEIELYIEVVLVKPQVNQSVGSYTDLLVRENDNVAEFDYGYGLSSGPTPDTEDVEYMEMMKTVKMKKLMMNLMKMLVMNLLEI